MTHLFLLDWSLLALSLFNTSLMLWLGLTIWLNAERRGLGIAVTSGSVLLGGVFFISHSALLALGEDATLTPTLEWWWWLGSLPLIGLPLAWYGVMAWFAGYWDPIAVGARRDAPQPQRWWLALCSSFALGLCLWIFVANPLPPFAQVARLDFSTPASPIGFAALMVVYPFYILLCLGLSFNALLRPGPAARLMGDQARRRARPWLITAALALLSVCFLVVGFIGWMFTTRAPFAERLLRLGGFDLLSQLCIALAIVALGQAIVAYEIFTGKTLPRRGLWRYWRNALILAAGFSGLMGASLTLRWPAIYQILLSLVLIMVFYALLSWRSYAEREQAMRQLRPFVASQRLYTQLTRDADLNLHAPFEALCREVLNTRRATLVAMGALSPLMTSPLSYPPNAGEAVSLSSTVISGLALHPSLACVPLTPAQDGLAWLVPLWSERGLIGALGLGDKQDGGLYSQEEIEIARATGERLIDLQAGVEMARRLIALQRQRLAESQLLDRQTRRALHDDVLPQLHTALLMLNRGDSAETQTRLTDLHRQISDLLRQMPRATAPDLVRLGLVEALRQLLTDELGHAFDEVVWQIAPPAESQARALPAFTAETLYYAAREALRNVAKHARPIEGAPLQVTISLTEAPGLTLIIEDNGQGLTAPTSQPLSSGQGLALHSALLALVGSTLEVASAVSGTRVVMSINMSD